MTNRDRLNQMSNKEFASWIVGIHGFGDDGFNYYEDGFSVVSEHEFDMSFEEYTRDGEPDLVKWLEAEIEE